MAESPKAKGRKDPRNTGLQYIRGAEKKGKVPAEERLERQPGEVGESGKVQRAPGDKGGFVTGRRWI